MFFGNIINFQTFRMNKCEKSINHIVSLPDEYVNELQLYRESYKLICMLDHSVYDIDLPGTGKTQ